jgi:urease accessory protein
MLEGYTHFRSLLFIHKNLTEATIKELQEVLIGINEEVRIGISRLPVQGLLIRMLGSQT